ncbi:MAG: hypothetical protein L3K01_02555 [Thermoplasmata archaeon]|nr:hypothetical protein [Thermoplasmata archaeon]
MRTAVPYVRVPGPISERFNRSRFAPAITAAFLVLLGTVLLVVDLGLPELQVPRTQGPGFYPTLAVGLLALGIGGFLAIITSPPFAKWYVNRLKARRPPPA